MKVPSIRVRKPQPHQRLVTRIRLPGALPSSPATQEEPVLSPDEQEQPADPQGQAHAQPDKLVEPAASDAQPPDDTPAQVQAQPASSYRRLAELYLTNLDRVLQLDS